MSRFTVRRSRLPVVVWSSPVFSDVLRDLCLGMPVSGASGVLQAVGCVCADVSRPAPLVCAALLCPHASLEAPLQEEPGTRLGGEQVAGVLRLQRPRGRCTLAPRPPRSRASLLAAPGLAGLGGGGGTWPGSPHVGLLLRRLRRPPGWPRLCLAWVSQSEALFDGSRVPSFILDRCPPVSLLCSDSISCCPGRACADTFLGAHAVCPARGAVRELSSQGPSRVPSCRLTNVIAVTCTTVYFRWELCLFVLKVLLCHI